MKTLSKIYDQKTNSPIVQTTSLTESIKTLLVGSKMGITQQLAQFMVNSKVVCRMMWDGIERQPYFLFLEKDIEVQYEGLIYDQNGFPHEIKNPRPIDARFVVPPNVNIYFRNDGTAFNRDYNLVKNGMSMRIDNFSFTQEPYTWQCKLDLHVDYSGINNNENAAISILSGIDYLTSEAS